MTIAVFLGSPRPDTQIQNAKLCLKQRIGYFFFFCPLGNAFGNRPDVSFVSLLSESKQSDIQVYIVLWYKAPTAYSFLLAGIQDIRGTHRLSERDTLGWGRVPGQH